MWCSICGSTPTCSRWSARCGRCATTRSGRCGSPGTDLPSLPDQDNSFAEVQSRIDKTVAALQAVRANQLDGKEDSKVTITVGGQPREFKAQNYLYHFAMLQVQFHATTAYDIIRHVGVTVGKRDYLGQMPS